MSMIPDIKRFELICVIVNYGLGSKVLKIAKQEGISGGTVLLGKGTVKNRLLEILEINDIRKEVVLLVTDCALVDAALKSLDREVQFRKPYHGIAFTIPVGAFLGTGDYNYKSHFIDGGKKENMYQSLFIIVDKGKGEDVMSAATSAGARGGTIINARGSGIHETSKLFNMEIEPEKELVMILAENALIDSIVSEVSTAMEIDKPGNGILFLLNVNKIMGLR